MLRVLTVLIAVLLLLAAGVETSCWAGDGDEDCCRTAQCSFCAQCAIVTLGASPLILPNRMTTLAAENVADLLSPDLGRLTPPPRF